MEQEQNRSKILTLPQMICLVAKHTECSQQSENNQKCVDVTVAD